MSYLQSALDRALTFANTMHARLPIFLGPMVGACPPPLASAVANAGGLGSCAAVLMTPSQMKSWAEAFRAESDSGFQINLWCPDPEPVRDADAESKMIDWLETWGPIIPRGAGDYRPPDFDLQCEALLEIAPPAVSSVMGLFPPAFVAKLKAQGIQWIANISTVTEALAAQQAGADAVVAQGMEAGGHRGCFDAEAAEATMVGLVSLLPAVVDAVRIPVIAAGGIGDARGVAAALMLGASAVQIGTGFLRTPEAAIAPAWADAIARVRPEDTMITRAFSGRAARSLTTDFTRACARTDAPPPRPYPVQRGLTQSMRDEAIRTNDIRTLQAWSGQSGHLARARPAADILRDLWTQTLNLLSHAPDDAV